jgi:hypothetical protein
VHEPSGVSKTFSQTNPVPYVLVGPVPLPLANDGTFATGADCPDGYVKVRYNQGDFNTNGFIPYKNGAGEYWPNGNMAIVGAKYSSIFVFIFVYQQWTAGSGASKVQDYSAYWTYTGGGAIPSGTIWYIYCELE